MIKFCAINESFVLKQHKNDINEKDKKVSQAVGKSEVLSKEKEEFRVRKLYEQALELQMHAKYDELVYLLEEILLSSIMRENLDINSHLNVVKAATYKLLANTHRKLTNYGESNISYQMALKMNSQDLNLWYGLAVTYEHLNCWDDAVEAYERVLRINSIHWPSLDALIVITFALVDFEKCAAYCEKALYVDDKYDTGVYILQRMFSYQPSLKTIMRSMLTEMPNIITDIVDDHVVNKLTMKISEIKAEVSYMREKAVNEQKIETLSFPTELKSLTWDDIAHSTLELFMTLKNSDTLDSMIDMSSLLPKELTKPLIQSIGDVSVNGDPLPWGPDSAIGTEVGFELLETLCDIASPKNATRITRNSSQQVESSCEMTDDKTEQYYARLIRMNILNEVHTMANEKFKDYNDVMSQKRKTKQPDLVPENINYRASPLSEESLELIITFIRSFESRKVNIIEVAWDLVKLLTTKEDFIWSSELVDDFLTLSSLTRIHVSSQLEESPEETLVSIKRLLFEVECLIDRKQSELEGKLHKSEKAFKLSDFVPHNCVEDFSNRIMLLEIKYGQEYEQELTVIQIRVLWLGFILADMFQNELEVRLQLDCLKLCLTSSNITVYLRPNCVHHSVITIKKIEDYLSASFKCLKIDLLCEMYKKEQYREIIEKTNNIIGAVTLPKEDYAEDMNNYMIQISFNCSSYHKILSCLLHGSTEPPTQDSLVRIYSDTTSVLEEITNIIDILDDPTKKNYTPLTERQMSFLTDNYFKVAKILLTNVTNFLKLLQLNNLNLIDIIGVGEMSRFIVLAKEYFYHAFYNKVAEINVAHIWCLYTHFKSLELFDPVRYNQSVTYNPVEELDLPPSLNFLSLTHDYLGSLGKCAQCDGAVLKLIITAVSEYIEEIRPKFRKLGVFLANHSDVLSILDQALYCIRPVQRPDIDKSRKPIEHGCEEEVSINIALVDLLLSYLEPERIPEVDSVKNLSISVDLNHLFLEIISSLPESIFAGACSEELIRDAIHSEEALNFKFVPRSKYSQLFYFVADHYFKNNEFEKALEYYIKNLRFTPICFDSWAGIALIYYKRLEDKFNMMDNHSESLSHEEVMCCFNSFNHAISLDSENLTILVEKGCFCYEVHSYASRILKKALTRDLDDTLVKDCDMWSKMMLDNAKECYEMAMDSNAYKGEKEEKWLYCYMLSKCMEKSEQHSMIDVLDSMERSMEALDSSGAKYVRKIVMYTKIPYRAVEAVEVYYKYHASILKCLLRNQSQLLSTENKQTSRLSSLGRSKTIDHNVLLEIQHRLIGMNQSAFIVNVGKVKSAKNGSKKRVLTKSDEYSEPTKVARLSPTNENVADAIDMANIPPELRYEDIDDECIIQEVILPSQAEDTKSVYERCVDLCRTAMEIVLQRLPLHYKAIYHLAYIHSYVPHLKNLDKSYDYLMGSSKSGKLTINGLFKDRKTSNFFSGIWRIPVTDIDRNGSFAHHMYRSMNLLMTVLRQLNAWKDLSSINTILRKTGSERRGFLSNADRQMLVRKSMGHSFYSVKEWLVEHRGDISKEDLILIQSLYFVAVKQSQGIEKMRAVLQEAFYRCVPAMELYMHVSSESNEEKGLGSLRIEALSMTVIDKVLANVREQKK